MQRKHVTRSKPVILILHDSVLWVIFPLQEVAGADKPVTNLKCNCYSVFLRQVCVSFPLSKQFKESQSSSILEARFLEIKKDLRKFSSYNENVILIFLFAIDGGTPLLWVRPCPRFCAPRLNEVFSYRHQ